MTTTGRAGAARTNPTVRYQAAPGRDPNPALVAELVLRVEERAAEWVAAIADFLGRVPAEPVRIEVQERTGLAMSRGGRISLAVPSLARPEAMHSVLGAVFTVLAHELVHAVAGRSSSRVLDEGLAVYTDSQLTLAGSVWPFYHLPPHRWVRWFRTEGTFIPLPELLSAARERPGGDGHRAAVQSARIYLEAGSYVGFLIDRHGLDRFWDLFDAGRPLPRSAPVESVESSWLASLGPALTAEECRRRDQSLSRRAHVEAVVEVRGASGRRGG